MHPSGSNHDSSIVSFHYTVYITFVREIAPEIAEKFYLRSKIALLLPKWMNDIFETKLCFFFLALPANRWFAIFFDYPILNAASRGHPWMWLVAFCSPLRRNQARVFVRLIKQYAALIVLLKQVLDCRDYAGATNEPVWWISRGVCLLYKGHDYYALAYSG